nr:hypothetical protein CFP56_43845 [Quercus suber]
MWSHNQVVAASRSRGSCADRLVISIHASIRVPRCIGKPPVLACQALHVMHTSSMSDTLRMVDALMISSLAFTGQIPDNYVTNNRIGASPPRPSPFALFTGQVTLLQDQCHAFWMRLHPVLI